MYLYSQELPVCQDTTLGRYPLLSVKYLRHRSGLLHLVSYKLCHSTFRPRGMIPVHKTSVFHINLWYLAILMLECTIFFVDTLKFHYVNLGNFEYYEI